MCVRPNIVILGASSLIGPWMLKQLTQKNFSGQCYNRTPVNFDRAKNFTWQAIDIAFPENFNPPHQSIVISLIPLFLLPPFLPQMVNCQQLIAFSTTRIFGKRESSCSKEQKIIKSFNLAEKRIRQIFTEQKIPWTILRPTLIYDGYSDQNITKMAKFIQKWKFLPLAHPANGLRQPVHADDLAAAAIAAIKNPSSYNRSFNLGGGEILTYRQMAYRVFNTLGMPSRILLLPPKLILSIFKLFKVLTTKGPGAEMFIRMNQDLIYDMASARQALDYTPRPFRPEFRLGQKT